MTALIETGVDFVAVSVTSLVRECSIFEVRAWPYVSLSCSGSREWSASEFGQECPETGSGNQLNTCK
jgi:hypothetical protein